MRAASLAAPQDHFATPFATANTNTLQSGSQREKADIWLRAKIRPQVRSGSEAEVAFGQGSTPESGHRCHARYVCFGPCVDGSGLARRIFTLQRWSEQPCVRPVYAVHMTAGHNALRGSGPGQKHAFEDAMVLVGCPDRPA